MTVHAAVWMQRRASERTHPAPAATPHCIYLLLRVIYSPPSPIFPLLSLSFSSSRRSLSLSLLPSDCSEPFACRSNPGITSAGTHIQSDSDLVNTMASVSSSLWAVSRAGRTIESQREQGRGQANSRGAARGGGRETLGRRNRSPSQLVRNSSSQRRLTWHSALHILLYTRLAASRNAPNSIPPERTRPVDPNAASSHHTEGATPCWNRQQRP
jgi:hypothetical protein